MRILRFSGCTLSALAVGLVAILSNVDAGAQQREPSSDGESYEILTRGPVHEAFAETISFDPEPGLIAAKAPPEPIEESPPEVRPEGANVVWIPGYWAWDDEREDFLWISGIWRSIPPGRQWIAGYWGTRRTGAQWTSGYWADAEQSEVEYLPEPPATVEAGPNVEAPSADHQWLPGCWMWQENRYAWRPGFWALGQANWDWVPAHYNWSPRGYVFVDGYYDYNVARRGVLFAPVYFRSNSYANQGFSYSPRSVVNLAVFGRHLFLRPNYGHYYYGDYYGSNYRTNGFSSWFSFHNGRSGYDPFYAQQRWNNRGNNNWDQTLRASFENRRDNEDARPPRDWSTQRERMTRDDVRKDPDFAITESIEDWQKNKRQEVRLRPTAPADREQFTKWSQEGRDARLERAKFEGQERDADSSTRPVGPTKGKMPRSPYISRTGDRLETDGAPPKRGDEPRPDPRIEPRPRQPRGETRGENDVPSGTDGIRKPRPDMPSKGPRPGDRPENRPETRPETRPEPKPNVKPETRPEPRPNAKPDPTPQPRPEPRPEVKPEPKPDRGPRPGAGPANPPKNVEPRPQPAPPRSGPGNGPGKGSGKGPGKGKSKD